LVLQLHASLIRRILENESCQAVKIVKLTCPTASLALRDDQALLDVHVNLRQMTVFAKNVLLDELVKQSLKNRRLVCSIHNGSLAFALLVGVRRQSTQLIPKELRGVLRRPLQSTGNVSHIYNASFDTITTALNLGHQARHLVTVLGVRVRGGDVAHRHGC